MSACSRIAHASHMDTTSTLDVHTLILDMFCIHSCYLSLFKPLALTTYPCVYVCLSISILGQFLLICSCLWNNLYLIKFVAMFVYGLFACVVFYRCPIDHHVVRNHWLISHQLWYQRRLVNHRETLTTRDLWLFWNLNLSTTSRMHLLWWKELWGLTHWDQPTSLRSLWTKIGPAYLITLKIPLKS